MDIVSIGLLSLVSVFYGRLLKSTINWLKVDGFIVNKNDLSELEYEAEHFRIKIKKWFFKIVISLNIYYPIFKK